MDSSISEASGYRIPQRGGAKNDFLVVCNGMKNIGKDLRNSAYSELKKWSLSMVSSHTKASSERDGREVAASVLGVTTLAGMVAAFTVGKNK